jgi:hypothetical protein
MKKETRALSGASQDAYFRRVLKDNAHLTAEERDRLLRKLRQEVAQVRVRVEPRKEGAASSRPAVPQEEPAAPASAPPFASDAAPAAPTVVAPAEAFDPFTPNVVVVVRKAGRAAALAALGAIASVDNLRLLAREQRLTVAADVSSAADIRVAIVSAAERRIANRMAAAG